MPSQVNQDYELVQPAWVIQEHARDPLTDEILFGVLEGGDGLAFDFKPTIVKEPGEKIEA